MDPVGRRVRYQRRCSEEEEKLDKKMSQKQRNRVL